MIPNTARIGVFLNGLEAAGGLLVVASPTDACEQHVACCLAGHDDPKEPVGQEEELNLFAHVRSRYLAASCLSQLMM